MYDLYRAYNTITLIVSSYYVNYSMISEDIIVITRDGVYMLKTSQLYPSL